MPTVQLVSGDWAVRSLQNEKYIYLDFAWILRALGWRVGWVEIGLTAVVLVVRPFIMLLGLHERVAWPLTAF